jgi:hypothetical protein
MVFVPELEEWLWCSPRSIARHLGVSDQEFGVLIEKAAVRLGKAPDRCRRELPKELFEMVLHGLKRRQPLPEDFTTLGSLADLTQWNGSEAFVRLTQILQEWFPPDQADKWDQE